jgi:hypothetical protein
MVLAFAGDSTISKFFDIVVNRSFGVFYIENQLFK